MTEFRIFDCVQKHHRKGTYKNSSKGIYVENKDRIYHKQIFCFLKPERKRAGFKRLPEWTWKLSESQC